nr:MraY family glycosyltransferase [uncultured Fluviicola sp.]
MSILPGITVLFFLGLKDDLVVLSPKTKLLGQVVACMFVLVNESFTFNNLHGFLGIYEIPLWVGVLGGLFLMLGIINSFNLIDGIDGLAASIAIIILSFFAVIFGVLDFRFSFLSSLSMIGIMIGFLFFNLSKRKKIFMGDTGSLQVGFIIAVMTMRLMTASEGQLNHLPFDSSYNPVVLIALLIVPLYDAFRVFTLRILKGKSPFSADRDHFHHLLIDAFKISHWKASCVIATFNIFFLGIILLILREFSIVAVCFVILFFLVLLTVYSIKLKKRIIGKLEKEENEAPKIGLFKPVPPSFHFEEQERVH